MEKNLDPVGEVSELCIYPVKSARVLNITSAECTEVGLYVPQMNIYDRLVTRTITYQYFYI